MNQERERLISSLVEIGKESYRLKKVHHSIIEKLDYEDQVRYNSQLSWFNKTVLTALQSAGMRIIEYENVPYDTGMAVTPLNLEDFSCEDNLEINQMIEPIIVIGDTVLREGTVILRKA